MEDANAISIAKIALDLMRESWVAEARIEKVQNEGLGFCVWPWETDCFRDEIGKSSNMGERISPEAAYAQT
jgi:hypothetical protein